ESTARHIAVGQTWRGIRSELLFEPGTYRFIGARNVADPDRSFQPKGDPAPSKDDPLGVDAKGLARKPYGADQKPGTVTTSWTIVEQRVVDAIPDAQLKS
ncbi:hypothetical protein ACFQ07_21435, partial [Actinomadura adrarensis]